MHNFICGFKSCICLCVCILKHMCYDLCVNVSVRMHTSVYF